jgi:deoxyadenosine/deoxycytidine kinase
MGPYEMGPYEIGPYEMGPYEIGPYEMGPYEWCVIVIMFVYMFISLSFISDIVKILTKKKRPIIVSIEGNIGTGKSTLLAKIQTYFDGLKMNKKIGYIPEPVAIWNSITDKSGTTILEKYYKNQEKYGFSFQMMAYISRLSVLQAALRQDYDIIIMERSMFTDREVFAKMLYVDGKIEEIEYNIYMKWFNEFLDMLPNIWHIYIQAEPTVSCERVMKRSRVGENIPLSYLERCHAYHENWLLNEPMVPTLLLDGNKEMNDEDYTEWLYKIENFIRIKYAKIC